MSRENNVAPKQILAAGRTIVMVRYISKDKSNPPLSTNITLQRINHSIIEEVYHRTNNSYNNILCMMAPVFNTLNVRSKSQKWLPSTGTAIDTLTFQIVHCDAAKKLVQWTTFNRCLKCDMHHCRNLFIKCRQCILQCSTIGVKIKMIG